jgi:hypothetical protein
LITFSEDFYLMIDSPWARYNRALEAGGCASILVVSGAGGKKPLTSVETVERAAASAPPPLPLGVAFNPHIGGALDPHCGESHREAEWQRLQRKLRSGACSQIWIAFGADVAGVPLYDSTFSRTVWRLYGGAKGLVMWC